MPLGRKQRKVLSMRVEDEMLSQVEDFRRAQLAVPTLTSATAALVKLGFEAWQRMEKDDGHGRSPRPRES